MLFDCLWGNVWWRASLLILSVWFCGIVSIGVAFWVLVVCLLLGDHWLVGFV